MCVHKFGNAYQRNETERQMTQSPQHQSQWRTGDMSVNCEHNNLVFGIVLKMRKIYFPHPFRTTEGSESFDVVANRISLKNKFTVASLLVAVT